MAYQLIGYLAIGFGYGNGSLRRPHAATPTNSRQVDRGRAVHHDSSRRSFRNRLVSPMLVPSPENHADSKFTALLAFWKHCHSRAVVVAALQRSESMRFYWSCVAGRNRTDISDPAAGLAECCEQRIVDTQKSPCRAQRAACTYVTPSHRHIRISVCCIGVSV